MQDRRGFISGSLTWCAGAIIGLSSCIKRADHKQKPSQRFDRPIVLSTWKHGIAANEAAYKLLKNGSGALDAVEQGVRIPESDPNVTSVGYGGLPDRDGNVTLDACIMDEKGNCGSVAFLQYIKNPISVARLVMEMTPHIMLAGEGALQFALDNGFVNENLLTENAMKRWEEWLAQSGYKPRKIHNSQLTINSRNQKSEDRMQNIMHDIYEMALGNNEKIPSFQKMESLYEFENHDTIGMVAMDNRGNLSGACTTSGLAWKYHGRVGDSPIIGAGLYVDNEIGAATATGKGEAVIKIAGSFLIVELMRQGYTPHAACEEAIGRIARKQDDYRDFQVGFLALNKRGEIGAYSLQKGFQYAIYANDENKLLESKFYMKQ